jgi:hypothetical protein
VLHLLPRNQFRHTPAFIGPTYSPDLTLLEITFISGRPKEGKLKLLKMLNDNIRALQRRAVPLGRDRYAREWDRGAL